MADREWIIPLPEACVGLDAIPQGKLPHQNGVMIGGSPGVTGIHHYTKDGLLIGTFGPDVKRFGGAKGDGNGISGLMDFFGALAEPADAFQAEKGRQNLHNRRATE